MVADEVRNLESKSAEASKNTSDLISGSIQASVELSNQSLALERLVGEFRLKNPEPTLECV